jgi:hypothetical protein
MIAVQIRVNGKLVATCGAGALRQFVAMVAAKWPTELPDSTTAHAAESGGAYSLDAGTNEVLKWVGTRIAVGDEISLKFVEAPPMRPPRNARADRTRPRSHR